MQFPREFVATLCRVVRRHWAEVVLLQLLAGLLQTVAHSLAVDVGRSDAVRGLLLSGLGTLFAVAGLVAVCVACHDTLRSVDGLPDEGQQRRQRIASMFAAAILPFFLTYVAWGLYRDDVERYARGALNTLDFSAGHGSRGSLVDVQFSALTVTIIVVCFLGRFVVRRWVPYLGGLRTLLMLLLEAVWAFLAALLIGDLIDTVVQYVAGTNLAVWLADTSTHPVLRPVQWLLAQLTTAGHAIFTPLLWVALAGLTVVRSAEGTRLTARLRAFLDRLPELVDDLVGEFVIDFRDRWIPVVATLSAIRRAGAVAVAWAVAVGIATTFAGGWLSVGLAHLPSPSAEPYTRMIGESLAGIGAQVTLAATITVALVTFDTMRLLARRSADQRGSAEQVDGQPGGRFHTDLQEQ